MIGPLVLLLFSILSVTGGKKIVVEQLHLSASLCPFRQCDTSMTTYELPPQQASLTVTDFMKLPNAELHLQSLADSIRQVTSSQLDNISVPSVQEVEECLSFLFAFMPAQDKNDLLISFISETVTLALRARYEMPWGLSVPWHIFLNDVLPYSSLTEPRERWRPLFFSYYSSVPALNNLSFSLAQAATWMNTYGWNIRDPRIVFRADPSPVGVWDYDPFSVLYNGYASCTGLSIFLVSALRSIGIPARVAGTPHWNLGPSVCPQGDQSPDCGNHDWVEVWADGGWAFVDEDGNTVLNTSWFVPHWTKHQSPASLNHSIFAASWANSSYIAAVYGGDSDPLALPFNYFPMVWNWSTKINSAWEVTRRYLLFS